MPSSTGEVPLAAALTAAVGGPHEDVAIHTEPGASFLKTTHLRVRPFATSAFVRSAD